MSTLSSGETRRRPRRARLDRGLLFVLPALILVFGVVYAGIGYTGWVSTLDWNGIDDNQEFIGLENFNAILHDEVFWRALSHVLIFAAITIVVQMTLGLIIALVVNSGGVRMQWIYKIVMFVPVVLAPAAVAAAMRQLLKPDGGVDQILAFFHLGFLQQDWLTDPTIALYTIAFINVWQWTGFSFILYQAALAQIDQEMFEAAQLDGAGALRTIWSVVIPQLKGTHATLALMGVIGGLKAFDVVFLTTGGGPGRATEFLTTYIYKESVRNFDAGYSAALSIVLVLLALALTGIQMRTYRFGKA